MKIQIIYLLLASCPFFLSCKKEVSSKNSHSFQVVDCRFTPGMSLKLSDFAESVEVIPLETTDGSLLGGIGNVKLFEDCYYISSYSSRVDRILQFDKHGHFIRKLDKRGMGPDEYIDIQDFDLLDKDKILTISRNDSRLYLYDIKQDSCLFSKKLPSYPLGLISDGKKIIWFNEGSLAFAGKHTPSTGLLQNLDMKGNLLKTYADLDQEARQKIHGTLPARTFSKCEDRIYFQYTFCDTLFEIKNGRLIPAFYIDFGEKKIPQGAFKDAKRDIMSMMKVVNQNKGVESIYYYEVTPSWLYLTFRDVESRGYIAYYNRNTHKTLLANRIEDDLLFPLTIIPLKFNFPKCFTGDYLIWDLESSYFKKIYDRYKGALTPEQFKKFRSTHKRLVSICENLTEEDNPVLLKIKMKKQ